MPQSGIVRWIVERLGIRMRARVVADEMKVVSTRRCDAEGLFHQAIRLIPITIRTVLLGHLKVRVATTRAFRRFASS